MIGSGPPGYARRVLLDELARAAGLGPPPAGVASAPVLAVTHDSRQAGPGSLFVAVPGQHTDGHDHALAARGAGAVAVVVERTPAGVADGRCLVTGDTRAALARLAARFWGDPSRRCRVVGVTGTDGKTTTTTLLHAALGGAGRRAGALTTVDFRTGAEVEPNRTRQTTLEAPEVQERLHQLVEAGCTEVALEVTSHALSLHRVDEVQFQGAVYTAVTHEHLDFHGSWGAYVGAKARLLEQAAGSPDGFAVLNRDDERGHARLAALSIPRRLTYSAAGLAAADLRGGRVRADAQGTRFFAETPWGGAEVALHLPGRWNVDNALAALAAGLLLGLPLDRLVRGLEACTHVSGRMERVDRGQPFAVIVDYAHTPASLARVLGTLRAATPGRLWVVFGSAGERDVAKRRSMGAIAAGLADQVVVTSEDPRAEDPEAITEAIVAGAREAGGDRGATVHAVVDRAAAIDFAIGRAQPGDTVLLAGKGHEQSILVGRTAQPWDERGAAERALARRGHRNTPAG